MKPLRTKLKLEGFPEKIEYQHSIFGMGSCFAVHMAEQLSTHKFKTALNPFGILYNPFSISQSIQRLIDATRYQPEEMFQHDGLWHSYDHHGVFSAPERELGLEKINTSLEKGSQFLQKADWCILTLGTAFVFVEKKQQRIVANCHKVPGSQFARIRLSMDEIVLQLSSSMESIRKINPSVKFILTVSPVRHIRDGLVENQRSKAALLLAAEALVGQFPGLYYFPSYELLLDDLRDYRFYESDLIHPNALAIEYIWERFGEAFFANDTLQLMKEVKKVMQAARHRPLHPQRAAHQQFIQAQLKKMEELERQHNFLDFGAERRILGR
jgi:hypothetical protein